MPNHHSRGRARHAAILLSTAGLLLTTAPTLAQSPQASPAASPASTPGATPVPIGTIDHPTEPTAIVLRMAVGGGFVPVEVNLTETPLFTLYGDNTVIFRPQPKNGMFPSPGEPLPQLIRAVLSPAQVDALLSFALGRGGLAAADAQYIEPLIADAPNTTFTVHAAGIDKEVLIQALGFQAEGPNAQIRQQFSALADVLDSFEESVAAGKVESAELYHPAAYRGMLTEVWEGATGTPIAWPWTDVAVDAFVGPDGGIATYAALTPAQVALVTSEPSGGITNILIETPAGDPWFFSVRPLLPDETFLPDGIILN